jgi:hypothetical protein
MLTLRPVSIAGRLLSAPVRGWLLSVAGFFSARYQPSGAIEIIWIA